MAQKSNADDCKMVVYMIENQINHKKYIGITTNSFKERYPHGIRAHHNPHLRKAVQKYGQDNFKVTILESNVKDLDSLCQLEIEYISKYDTCNKNNGYNKSLGGLGVRQTERSKEHCEKIRQSKLGLDPMRFLNPEQMKARNEKISKATKGVNNPMYGKTFDKLRPETQQKLREAAMGENNAMYGKHLHDVMTEEQWNKWLRKQKENKVGSKNPKARPSVVVYKGKRYDFGYIDGAVEWFKNKGIFISRNWFYHGIPIAHRHLFQYCGSKMEYEKLKNIS